MLKSKNGKVRCQKAYYGRVENSLHIMCSRGYKESCAHVKYCHDASKWVLNDTANSCPKNPERDKLVRDGN